MFHPSFAISRGFYFFPGGWKWVLYTQFLMISILSFFPFKGEPATSSSSDVGLGLSDGITTLYTRTPYTFNIQVLTQSKPIVKMSVTLVGIFNENRFQVPILSQVDFSNSINYTIPAQTPNGEMYHLEVIGNTQDGSSSLGKSPVFRILGGSVSLDGRSSFRKPKNFPNRLTCV